MKIRQVIRAKMVKPKPRVVWAGLGADRRFYECKVAVREGSWEIVYQYCPINL